MKFFTSQLSYFFQIGVARRNIKVLMKFFIALLAMITTYSLLFHYIMELEGQKHSWITGFYWTLTVMSTLGFGDITFTNDIGRVFSSVVLLSGVVFLLVIMPFTFIQFFYAPWMEARSKSRAPRELPPDTKDHIIITHFDNVTDELIDKLVYYKRDYVLIIEELPKALELYDMGYKVAVGAVDDLQTYQKMRVENAALVVATGSDEINTNIAFTVRELCSNVPIVTNANISDSVDILELAGASYVLRLKRMLGNSLARRSIIGGAKSNVIGRFGELVIAEAPAIGTPLVGKSIKQSGLREKIGVNVVGIWERGVFHNPNPESIIRNTTVLVLAGNEEQLNLYDEIFCIYHNTSSPVIIIGGGRVGSAAADYFDQTEADYLIIEKNRYEDVNSDKVIIGDAADINVLKNAGIEQAPAVIITTKEDAVNIYLTLYCRKLRPDMQIISRSNQEKNVSTLHRAGADIVMSYASLGANAILNLLQRAQVLMVAEGLDVIKMSVPHKLIGLNLIESQIRQKTNCNVIAIVKNGDMLINPMPTIIFQKDDEIVIIATNEAEIKFNAVFLN